MESQKSFYRIRATTSIELKGHLMPFKHVVDDIYRLTVQHHAWRSSCLNMVASESLTSSLVEALLASDFSRRYSESHAFHAGDRYYREIEDIVEDLARQVYKASYVELRPPTGNLTVLAVLCGLTKPGDTVVTCSPYGGGYPIALVAEWANIEVAYYPFDQDSLNIQVEESCQLIRDVNPNLVILGASRFLFPHPVEALSEAAHAIGVPVYYDGSHVMGLIVSRHFQDPFAEGADILAGSTHKTIFGPQRGVIATNDEGLYRRISDVLTGDPFLVSCHHPGSLVALGVALAETLEFGDAFAGQVVRNAQALGEAMLGRGLPVLGAGMGFTQSHQVILSFETLFSPTAWEIKSKLEEVGVIADATVRFGTQELTRLGMKEREMQQVADLIADTIQETRDPAAIREDVQELAGGFKRVHYTFSDGEEAYTFLGSRLGLV
jgi:glycine hydroxymethyltransferase